MPPNYSYDVWNGKEVVGQFFSLFPLNGKWLVIPELSPFKESFFRKLKQIKIPLLYRKVYDDGVEFRFRIVLDVRKKSKRQIATILGEK